MAGFAYDRVVTALRSGLDGGCQRFFGFFCYFFIFIAENIRGIFKKEIDLRIDFGGKALRQNHDKTGYASVANRRRASFKVQIKRRVGYTGNGIAVISEHIKSVFGVVGTDVYLASYIAFSKILRIAETFIGVFRQSACRERRCVDIIRNSKEFCGDVLRIGAVFCYKHIGGIRAFCQSDAVDSRNVFHILIFKAEGGDKLIIKKIVL